MSSPLLSAMIRHEPLEPTKVDASSVPVGSEAMARENLSPILVPYLTESLELTDDTPSVRLDPIRSGLGSMTVRGLIGGHGVEAYVWENNQLQGGIVLPDDSGAKPPTVAVSYHHKVGQNTVVVDMSRFRDLRRLVLASQTTDLVITLAPSGKQIMLRTYGGDCVFHVYRIGNEVEIRREPIFTHDLLGAFGVEHTPFPAPALASQPKLNRW